MVFERLKGEHLSQIEAIEKEAFDDAWNANMFLPELSDEHARYLVGVEDGEVICYGGFHSVLDEAQFANIAVRRDKRGLGIGKTLLAELLKEAKSSGVKYMTLEVKDTNERAIGLYKSFGFEIAGVRRKYYANRYDAYVMRLNIEED